MHKVGSITPLSVISSVSICALDRFWRGIKKLRVNFMVGCFIVSEFDKENFIRVRANSQMQFPPSPAFAVSMLAHFPFTLSKHLKSCRIDDGVGDRSLCQTLQVFAERFSATAN